MTGRWVTGHREFRTGRRQVRGPRSAGPAVIGTTHRIRHISHISLIEPGCRNLNRVSDHDRTLVLLRHAKSAYPDEVADHERPLAPRGEREAGLAGDWLRTHLPAIDAVLCSTAIRTRETLARTGIDAPVRYVERLYDATAGTVIDEINSVGDDVSVLLVIGHEPTMTEVALGLADPEATNADAAERISTKFPTSAMAVLRLNGSWTDLELGSAQLADFHVPR